MVMVVNKYKEDYDIYIGRGSLWGNPYVIGVDGDRDQVIEKFRQLLWRNLKSGKVTKDMLLSLKNKKLGCFCKPLACHGDVIVSAVNWADSENKAGDTE